MFGEKSEKTNKLIKGLSQHPDFQGLEIMDIMDYPGSKYEYLAISYDDPSDTYLITPFRVTGGKYDARTAASEEAYGRQEAYQKAKEMKEKSKRQFRDQQDREARDPEGRLT